MNRFTNHLLNILLPDLLSAPLLVTTQNLATIEPISSSSNLSIAASDRFNLEKLIDIKNIRWYPSGLSETTKHKATHAINKLIVKNSFISNKFPVTEFHGVSASSSNLTDFISLSEFGSNCLGMRDIIEMSTSEIIDHCKQWEHLGTNDSLSIITDDWHRKYYWMNTGGSHHFAVLVHLLKKQNITHYVNGDITRYQVNINSIKAVKDSVSFYVVKTINNEAPLTFLGFTHVDENLLTKLGLGICSMEFTSLSPFAGHHIVAIDNKAPLAFLMKRRFDKLKSHRKALTLENFLLS